MTGEQDLDVLLRSMSPSVRHGEFVVVTLPALPDDLAVEATVREDDGVTAVVRRTDADSRSLPQDPVLGWITLTVHSSLEAVGLTAAVSAALTARGISCNVLAGHFHDHLLVPHDRVADAVEALNELAAASGPGA